MVDTTIVSAAQRSRIGKYVVDRKIGQGGMGVVYLGRNESLKSQIVIKTMLLESANDALLRSKFLEEGVKQAKLNHPNILTIHDSGETDGTLYLVMEYAPNGSLRERMELTAIPAAQAASIVRQIASAVDHAHHRPEPLIHLDIKPENILFVGDMPKLADFGIAHAVVQGHGPTPTLLGFSSDYAPPEQIEGRPEAGSDIYALGQLLLRLLSGAAWRKVTVMSDAERRLIREMLPATGRKYASIIADCVQGSVSKRPTASELTRRLSQLESRSRTPLMLTLVALAVTALAIGTNSGVRNWTADLFEQLFPGEVQTATFSVHPADAQLWIDGQPIDERRAELANGPHEVAAVAKGFTGHIEQVVISTPQPRVNLALERNPNTADFEYLSFQQGYMKERSDPDHQRVMQTRWTDPVLANLVAMEASLAPAPARTNRLVEKLSALARYSDEDAITTLFLAARRLSNTDTQAAYLADLERIADTGYGLAATAAAEYYIEKMRTAGDDAERARTRAKVNSYLRKATNSGMSDTAAILLRGMSSDS